MPTETTSRRQSGDCACPFCALACDDLVLERADDGGMIAAVDCALARTRFANQRADATPRVGGRSATLDAALQAAAERVAACTRLLVTGLALDVAGARAAVRFAQRHGALIDHRAGSRVQANQRVFQRRGWITTTYSEARNHGDCFLFVGTDAVSANPRFVERVLAPREALFTRSARRVLYLGLRDAGLADKVAPAVLAAEVDARSDGDLLAALTAIGGALRYGTPAGDALAPIVRELAAARYAVVIWDVAAFANSHAELVVEAIVDLVAAANLTTRCAGLPLGRDATFTTANQVATWLTGFALPVAFVDGVARHDPERYSAARWLAEGTADVVMTIDAWAGAPRADVGRAQDIVIAPVMAPESPEPDVFIPVAVPGRDTAGQLFRGDGVVAHPLRPLARADATRVVEGLDDSDGEGAAPQRPFAGGETPSVAEVLAVIEARMQATAAA